MITLKNLSKRTVIFNLPHAVACSETVCTCSRVKAGVVDHDKVTGDRKVRAVNQRLGHSVTLFPKGTRHAIVGPDGKPSGDYESLDEATDLLDGVALVSEIVQAKARFEIEITRQPNAAPAPASPAASSPAEVRGSRSTRNAPAAETTAATPKE